jgi:electron transfer flavoprotein beta subunit
VKIVVVFKWTRNPQDAIVRQDGNIEWRGVKLSPTDDDPAAAEIAKKLAQGGEIVGLTIGDGDASWAAARGATRTVLVEDAAVEADAALSGAILAAAVQKVPDVDLLLIGDSAWDYAVVSALAGRLGWPALSGVTEAEADGAGLKVTQKSGSVSRIVKTAGPVVLGVTASREEKNVPGMKEILAARKKPVEKLKLADLGALPAAKASLRSTRFPDTPPAKIIDGRDPAAACAELLSFLAADGVL